MRWLAPEVIQQTRVDCGVAALKILAEGHGLRVGYARLRELCQTAIDGTSLDDLEEAACALGLDAVQILIPPEHVALPEAAALPALVVTLTPGGLTHFLVAWRRLGSWLQLSDPAAGRRWAGAERFAGQLYVHEVRVDEETALRWLASENFLGGLRARLVAGRLDPGMIAARAEEPWRLAALDAALRALEDQPRTPEALESLAAAAERDPGALPADLWSALQLPDGEWRLRGAVLITARRARAGQEPPQELREDRPRPWALAWGLLSRSDRIGLPLLSLAAAAAELYTALRWGEGAGWSQVFALIALEGLRVAWARSSGRRLAGALSEALRRRLPTLGLEFHDSRPADDLAGLLLSLDDLRALPGRASGLLRGLALALGLGAALGRVAPGLAFALISVVVGGSALAWLLGREAELRARSLAGALGRWATDAVRGREVLLAQGGEAVLAQEHARQLAAWERASWARIGPEHALGLLCVLGAAAALTLWPGGASALAVYAALRLLGLGPTGVEGLRVLSTLRVTLLRALEPLEAPAEADPVEPEPLDDVGVDLEDMEVVKGGHAVLSASKLWIPAGQQVAVVGASGSGKSTLLGLLLGFDRPAAGALRVGGRPLQPAALRSRIAWVDASVQVRDASIEENVAWIAGEGPGVAEAMALAGLDLALGPPGEGGVALSAGEAQRVRLARALAQREVRLVLLDEAFRGLERPERARLLGVFRARWPGATLLCATHDLAETRDFDRVILLDGGRIVEDEGPARLLEDPDSRYARMLAQEARNLAELWEHPGWRRLGLSAGEGRLQEAGAAPILPAIPGEIEEQEGDPRLWPLARLGEGLDRLLGPGPTPAPRPAEADEAWLRRCLAARGFLAETGLRRAADLEIRPPAVLLLPGGAALIGGRGERLTLLGPDGARASESAQRVKDWLNAPSPGAARHPLPAGEGEAPSPAPPGSGPARAHRLIFGLYRLRPVERPDEGPGLGALALTLAAALARALGLGALGLAMLGQARLALPLAALVAGLGAEALRAGRGALRIRTGARIRRNFLAHALAGEGRVLGPGRVLSRLHTLERGAEARARALGHAAGAAANLGVAAWLLPPGAVGVLAAGVALIAAFPLRPRLLAELRARAALSGRLIERVAGQRTLRVQPPPARAQAAEARLAEELSSQERAAERVISGLSLLCLLALAPLAWEPPGAAILVGLPLGAWGLHELVRARVAAMKAAIAREEAAELLGLASEPAPQPEALDQRQAPVVARGLALRARRPLIQGLNLAIQRGDRLLLTGASGAGKSTLARALGGLRPPDAGELRLWGVDASGVSPSSWRGRVVVVPPWERNHVFAESLAFNLLCMRRWPPRPEDLAEAGRVCRALGLDGLLERMPAGLDTLVGETGWRLSQGERARLFVARALLQRPELLVLDECFGPLDPTLQAEALRAALLEAPTAVVIAHP